MDDHFWPAIYPGIVIGLMVGLTGRNIVSALLGAIGGLIGSIAGYFLYVGIGLSDGLVSLVILICGSAAGAYILMRIGDGLRGASKDKPS